MIKKGLIYVGGVPGVGKTTLCRFLSTQLGKIIYVSSGEIKRIEARKRYNLALSKLDQEKSLEINRWFFNELYKKTSPSIYLVDTHYTYPLPDSTFVNLCPDDIVGGIKQFILIDSSPADVIYRRIIRGRDRDSINLDFIKLELEKEKQEALRLSNKFDIPLSIFRNENGFEYSSSCFQNLFLT